MADSCGQGFVRELLFRLRYCLGIPAHYAGKRVV